MQRNLDFINKLLKDRQAKCRGDNA